MTRNNIFLIILIYFWTCDCQSDNYYSGNVNPLSIGGEYINKGECPWLCPIFVKPDNGEEKYLCSSSLITNKFVLTGL